MSYRGVKALLLACSGVGVLLAATADANAGGFALREQSSFGQGSSFAGVAAGGSLSSMFWNPATMTQVPGLQSESVLTGIMPYTSHTVTSGTFAGLGGAGDSSLDALLPAGYYSWQVNPQLWLGLSINTPFGLAVNFPDAWAGRNYSGATKLQSYNGTPSVAYQINNWISVGAGVQIQYAKADLATGLPVDAFGAHPGLTNQASISGSGWGYGFTAGLTLTPTPTTTIGLGWRSAINQKIDGTLGLPAGVPLPPLGGANIFRPPFSTPGDVSTTLNLPDIVSLGLRQKLTSQWTLMATGEWANWSRIGTATVQQSNGAPATVLAGLGGGAVTLPFQYRDGWFFSLGAEYQWTSQLALRAGIGFEQTPISDQVRTPRLPDNDRTWLSIGATYQWTPKMSFDFAYSHLFVKNTPINISADSGNPWFSGVSYVGSVSSHVDIVSLALKYRWDDPAPAPMHQRYSK
jgi:long-chain fatty acid transport protein